MKMAIACTRRAWTSTRGNGRSRSRETASTCADGLILERGTLALDVQGKQVDPDTRTWTVTTRVADLAGRVGDTPASLRQEVILGVTVRQAADVLSLEGASITSAFLTAEGKGDL